MSATFMIRDAAAPADPDSDLKFRWENTINAPVISASFPENGRAVAGVYTMTAASSSTINITSQDTKNELIGTGVAVTADGVTENDLGFGVFVFSASLATGWEAVAGVGALMAGDGSTVRRLNAGIVDVDTTDTQRRVTAVNIGTETSAETAVYGLPGAFHKGAGSELYIAKLKPHSDPARHALAIPADNVISFTDHQIGPPETNDVWINDGGGAVKCIEDAVFDGTLYEYGVSGYINAADALRGLAIAFTVDPGDPTALTFDVLVRDSSAWIEFAPDVAGSPGTWGAGPLTLTQTGQVSGVVLAAGTVNFWRRLNIPAGVLPDDMRLHTYRINGKRV